MAPLGAYSYAFHLPIVNNLRIPVKCVPQTGGKQTWGSARPIGKHHGVVRHMGPRHTQPFTTIRQEGGGWEQEKWQGHGIKSAVLETDATIPHKTLNAACSYAGGGKQTRNRIAST